MFSMVHVVVVCDIYIYTQQIYTYIYIYTCVYIHIICLYIYIYIVKSRVILLLNICYVMNLVGCGGFREIQSELLDFTKHV